MNTPITVGLVGTGFAAKLRADYLQQDDRARLVAVAGHRAEKTREFSHTYDAQAFDSWETLLDRPDLDLIIICTINRDHGTIARAALEAGKQVIVEYPLALDPHEARAIVQLARDRRQLLHVEHIELLGGVHHAFKDALEAVGRVFYARYITFSPKRPAPQKWTYHRDWFGFPLVGALSRVHRITDALGSVATVSGQSQFWDASEPGFYTACLCDAQLRLADGAIAEIVYGKGDRFWKAERKLEVHGSSATLIIDGDTGLLVRDDQTTELPIASRRGLFARDTAAVLDTLTTGKPLYVTPEQSLYSLQVADAIRQSCDTGQTILVD